MMFQPPHIDYTVSNVRLTVNDELKLKQTVVGGKPRIPSVNSIFGVTFELLTSGIPT